MNAEHLIGVDVGTYSAKGVLVDRTGTIKATHTVEYDVSFPRPGWAEHDADGIWWTSFATIVRTLLERGGVDKDDVAAVGCSAIGITMLPVGTDGRPLRPSVLYGIDTRALREIDELNALLGRDAIAARSGAVLSANSVGPKISWLRNHEPEVFAKTHKVLTASSYLVHRLTGEFTVDSGSAGSYAPMWDVATGTWDATATAAVCPLEWLPTIHRATDVVGGVHAQAAAETGLAEGTPVIAGLVDAAAEAISVGVTAPGDGMLMLGSTVVLSQVLGQPLPNHRSRRHIVKDTHAIGAALATSAAITRWYVDNFGQGELAGERETGTSAYGALADEAARVRPGSEGLVLLPYFSGERAPFHDPLARGVIAGLTLSHTRSHVYRAILEGVGYSIRHNLEAWGELGARPQRLVAVGGGTKNALWLQIIADSTGRTLEVPALTIGAAYGDAYLAGIGVGMFDDFVPLRDWVTIDRVVEPNVEHRAVYDTVYDVYRRTYLNLREELNDLARLQTRSSSA